MRTIVENDYDVIQKRLQDAISVLSGGAHEPTDPNDTITRDSVTITKDGLLTAIIKLQRLANYVEGLSAVHVASKKKSDVPADVDKGERVL